MSLFFTKSKIVVTCHKYLSAYLAKEIQDLGFEIEKVFLTGVILNGNLNDCIMLNVNLKCASQVLYSIKSFNCEHPDDVYDNLIKLPWETYIENDTYFSVTSNVFHETVNNNMFVNVRIKDAIVDAFRDKGFERPNAGPLKDAAVFHLFWKHDEAELFIDTSGETLAKHGYRKLPGAAPMLEALAFATIDAGVWDKKTAFINPMCGSGTLAIEAALIASNRKSSLLRDNYAFMHLKNYDDEVYHSAMDVVLENINPNPNIKIIASDISAKAIEVAKQNAQNADVEHLIEFIVCDFESTPIPETNKGVVYINPEYGERLGEIDDLEITYKRMGDFFKNKCKGYQTYIFTGNLDLAKKIGLKASKRIEFMNGKIDCRLLHFDIYEGTKRVFKKTD